MPIIDNRGQANCAQREDVEDLTDNYVGDKIFKLFLNLEQSRLTSIINIKKQLHRDSACL